MKWTHQTLSATLKRISADIYNHSDPRPFTVPSRQAARYIWEQRELDTTVRGMLA